MRDYIAGDRAVTTTNELRRRESDKVDQISLKYQLEKANARIAELDAVIIKVKDCLIKNLQVIVANDYELEDLLSEVLRLAIYPPVNQDE